MRERIGPVPEEVLPNQKDSDAVWNNENTFDDFSCPSTAAPGYSFAKRLDRYLRKNNTVLARAANLICPYEGERYLNSWQKRLLDLVVSAPMAAGAVPAIIAFGLAKKIEDGGTVFFIQERLSNAPEQTINVVKIRCMKPNSDAGSGNLQIAQGLEASKDPRNTKLGSFMRKYQIEELPQLFQVVLGELSAVGIRPETEYGFDYLRGIWGQGRFERWLAAYRSGRLGLSGVNQVFGSSFKEDRSRFHADVFYWEHASLGLDLYLLWGTAVKLLSSEA